MDNSPMNESELLNLIPLENSTKQVAEDILKETDLDKLKNLTDLFNLNQAKKNVLRVLKFNSLLDKVSDQMLARFEQHPGEFSNSDLLNYLTVTQNAIDRANKSLALVDNTPAIQINQVNITNNDAELSRESTARVMEAVQSLLNKAKELQVLNNHEEQSDQLIIDVEDEKLDDIDENAEEK